MSGNHLLKTDLILASGNPFSSQWKPFSSIVSDITHRVLHPGQWKHNFQSKKRKYCFLLRTFFLLVETIREAYLKLLPSRHDVVSTSVLRRIDVETTSYVYWVSLLLATTFFDFSNIPANISKFFLQQERILKQILHCCWWNLIFCLLEKVFFYLEIFFCQRDHRGNPNFEK